MKKKTNTTKLVLSKKTIVDLNNHDMQTVKGGYFTDPRYCTWVTCFGCGTGVGEFTCAKC